MTPRRSRRRHIIGRIAWALLSVGVIYACAWLFASLIGGLS